MFYWYLLRVLGTYLCISIVQQRERVVLYV